jgi:diguanylate cyclase (GGDEF)-like protein
MGTAKKVAERIRASVEKRSFIANEGLNIRFTVSIGVALFPDHARSKKEIIEAADHAMYASKKKSRNSVTIAELKAPPAEAPAQVEAPPKAKPAG